MAILKLFALILTIYLTRVEAEFVLDGKSFSIRSTVVNLLPGGSVVSKVHESYSAEQKRARINFALITQSNVKSIRDLGPKKGVYHLDASDILDRIALFVNDTDKQCQSTTYNTIIQTFYPNNMRDLDVSITEDFIVGPAWFLFFIEMNRDRMKLKNKLNEGVSLKVRNLPALQYTFDYVLKYNRSIEVSAYYSEASLVADSQSLPMQIIIQYLNGQVLIIDYSRVELLDQSASRGEVGGGVSLDEFIIEPASSCSKILDNRKEELFLQRAKKTTKFSFKSEVSFPGPIDQPYVKVDYFVAYDSKLDSMYLDLSTAQSTNVRNEMFNFKLNRMYHIVKNSANPSNPLNRLLGTEINRNAGLVTRCVSSKIMQIPPQDQLFIGRTARRFTIGQLLAGADEFVYLGKAEVRGVKASVYETSGGVSDLMMPFWIEQPVSYRTYDGQNMWRKSTQDAQGNVSVNRTIVLYLSGESQDQTLLLIEIYTYDNGVMIEKQPVYFHNFVWDINGQSSIGGFRATEMFSIADLCSTSFGQNQDARINLLLESDQSLSANSNHSLDIPATRDLSLLAALQESLNVPATMIYDLESKIVKLSNNSSKSFIKPDKKDTTVILTSFRIAEEHENLAELVYVGQGRQREILGQRRDRLGLIVRSLLACYSLASHRRVNLYFAYQPRFKLCTIDLEPIVAKQATDVNQTEDPEGFELIPGEELEIYRINHVFNLLPGLKRIINIIHTRDKFTVLGTKLKLLDVLPKGGEVAMRVKQFRVDDLDYKSATDQASGNDEQLNIAKIRGFGLVNDAANNKKILPESVNVDSWMDGSTERTTLMTYDQCHAHCMADFDCQSFSFCILDGEAQCITSKTSFRSNKVVKQLESIRTNTTQRARKVRVTLNNEYNVELVQHPNCELYNKNYLDLFKKPRHIRRPYNNRRVYPVTSQEECAELCFRRNLEVLRNDTSRIRPHILHYQKIGGLVEKHYRPSRGLCVEFLYVDRGELQVEDNQLDQLLANRIISTTQTALNRAEGYCIVGARKSQQEEQELIEAGKNSNGSVRDCEFETYAFEFQFFYEKRYGVRLFASPTTSEEYDAYRSLRRSNQEVTESAYEVMRMFVDRGDNLQEVMPHDEYECALACFLQSSGPWPACTSFDISIDLRRNKYIYCYLNSITLRQAISTERFDLIEYTNKGQLWHYEPKPGLILEESQLNAKFFQDSLMAYINSTRKLVNLTIHTFGTLCLSILGVVSGVIVGVQLGRNILQRFEGDQTFDRQILVDSRKSIQFANQVNSEGIIPLDN